MYLSSPSLNYLFISSYIFYLFVHVFIYLFCTYQVLIFLFIDLLIYLFNYLFTYLFTYALSTHLFLYFSIYLSNRFSITFVFTYYSICPSINIGIYLFLNNSFIYSSSFHSCIHFFIPSLTLWRRNFLLNFSTPVFKM